MTNWAPESIRGWIMKHLYERYMADPRDYVIIKDEVSDESEPAFLDVYREVEMLERGGYANVLSKAQKMLSVRLTVDGRIAIESAKQQPDEPMRGPLGFVLED